MNKPLVWPNTTVPILRYLGDLPVDWKVQLVLSSHLIFSLVQTSSNNLDLGTVVKYKIAFLSAKSNLLYLKPQFYCPEPCESTNDIAKGLPIKKLVARYSVIPQDLSNFS